MNSSRKTDNGLSTGWATRHATGRATGVAGVIAALLTTAPAHAEHPGYVVDSEDQVVRSGFGECVHTSRWSPELRVPECGGQQAAAEPAPEPTTEHAAFEPEKRPLETLTLDARTLFAFDKAELRPEAREQLDALARRMSGQSQVLFINITGHADRIGDPDYNRMLSKERATAVADYLQQHTDLRTSKFQLQGVGESQPLVECDATGSNTALIQCLEPNRRVEIEVSLQQPATTTSP